MKNKIIQFRTTSEVKAAAEIGAKRQRRSMSAYLEYLILKDNGGLNMKKTIICDCWHLGDKREYTGEPIHHGEAIGNDLIRLSSGVTLRDFRDGRLCDSGDESRLWATVETHEYDENGELIQGDLVGYVEV